MTRRLNSDIQSNMKRWWEWHIIPALKKFLYDLTFCDPLGINISTSPETLHAILIGHGTCLLHAFERLEKEQKKKKKKDEGEEEECSTTPLYTAKYRDSTVDKNTSLICEWGKETDLNHLSKEKIESKTIFG